MEASSGSASRPPLGDLISQMPSTTSPRAHRFNLFSAQNAILVEGSAAVTSNAASSRNVPRLQSPSAFGGSALTALDGLESGFGVRRRAELLDPAVVSSPTTLHSALRSPGAFDRAQWIMAAERYKSGLLSPARAQQAAIASPVVRTFSANRMDLAPRHSPANGLGANSSALASRLEVAADLQAQVTPHRRAQWMYTGSEARVTEEEGKQEIEPQSVTADERIYHNPRVKAWRVYKAVLKIILEDISRNNTRSYALSASKALADLDRLVATRVGELSAQDAVRADRLYADIVALSQDTTGNRLRGIQSVQQGVRFVGSGIDSSSSSHGSSNAGSHVFVDALRGGERLSAETAGRETPSIAPELRQAAQHAAPTLESSVQGNGLGVHFHPSTSIGQSVAGATQGASLLQTVQAARASGKMTEGATKYAFAGLPENGELSFKAGQRLLILQKEHPQWWYGELSDGQRGWFPKSYVSPVTADQATGVESAPEAVLSKLLPSGESSPQQLVNAIMEAFSTGKFATNPVGPSAAADVAEGSATPQSIIALLGGSPVAAGGAGKLAQRGKTGEKLSQRGWQGTGDEHTASRRASIADMADAIADVWLTGDVAAEDDAEEALAHSPVLGAPRSAVSVANAQLLQPRQRPRVQARKEQLAASNCTSGNVFTTSREPSAFFPDAAAGDVGLEDFAFSYSDNDSVNLGGDDTHASGVAVPADMGGGTASEAVDIPQLQIESSDSFAAILAKAATIARDAANNSTVVTALSAQTGFPVETILEAAMELEALSSTTRSEEHDTFQHNSANMSFHDLPGPRNQHVMSVPQRALASPSGYQVVVQPDGRRVKMLAMDGSELWDLFRTKLRALAVVYSCCRNALASRRWTKLAVVEYLSAAAQRRRWAVRFLKLFSVGLARRTCINKALSARAPKLLLLGVCRLMLRWNVAHVRQNEIKSPAAKIAKPVDTEDPSAPKTRAIHWETINDTNVSGTIWDREQRGSASSLDLTNLMPNLVEKFAVQAGHSGKLSDSTKGAAPVAKANQPITLLASQKAQNVAIALSNIVGRRSLSEIRDALYAVDDELLGGGIDRVQILLGLDIYSPDTTNPIKDYSGDVSRLAAPERFIKEVVLTIPALPTRLAVMEFHLLLPDLLAASQEKLDCVTEATQEVTSSQSFATILLDVILPLGNKLNALSRKGTAAGFRLTSLNKLVQTKSGNGETFLRFIVEGLLEQSPKLLSVYEDFKALQRARGPLVALPLVAEAIAKIEKGYRQVEALLARSKGPGDEVLVRRLTPLLAQSKAMHTQLKEDMVRTQTEFDDLCRWLGEDPSKTTPESLFGVIQGFLVAFNQEAKAARDRAERLAKAEARKAKEESRPSPNRDTPPEGKKISRRMSRAIVNAVLSVTPPDRHPAELTGVVESVASPSEARVVSPPSAPLLRRASSASPPVLQVQRHIPSSPPIMVAEEVSPTRRSRPSFAGAAVAAALAAATTLARQPSLSGRMNAITESAPEDEHDGQDEDNAESPSKLTISPARTVLAPPSKNSASKRLSVFDIHSAKLRGERIEGVGTTTLSPPTTGSPDHMRRPSRSPVNTPPAVVAPAISLLPPPPPRSGLSPLTQPRGPASLPLPPPPATASITPTLDTRHASATPPITNRYSRPSSGHTR